MQKKGMQILANTISQDQDQDRYFAAILSVEFTQHAAMEKVKKVGGHLHSVLQNCKCHREN